MLLKILPTQFSHAFGLVVNQQVHEIEYNRLLYKKRMTFIRAGIDYEMSRMGYDFGGLVILILYVPTFSTNDVIAPLSRTKYLDRDTTPYRDYRGN